MLEHSGIQCFEKHELPLTSKPGKTSRRAEKKFYPSDKYILLACGEVLGVKYLRGTADLGTECPDESIKLLSNHIYPIVSISIAEDSTLVCTCSDEAVILWKLESELKSWASKTIAVDLGRVSTSAICTNGENIFTSLVRGNEIIVLQCVRYSDITSENGTLKLRDIELLATSDKSIEQNSWIHNFLFDGNQLHIAGLSSGNSVALQVWEVSRQNIKLKYRCALQMKILATADAFERNGECYIVAISPEGHCETFVGTSINGFCILTRIKIDEGVPNFTAISNSDMHVEFRICCVRFFDPKMMPLDDSILNKTDESIRFSLDNSLTISGRKGLNCPKLLICVVTTTAISIFNIRSGETELNLQYEGLLKDRNVIISTAKLVSLENGELILAYQPFLQDSVFTFRIQFFDTELDETNADVRVSLISSVPIRAKSVLRKKLKSPRQQSMPSRRMTLGFPILRSKSKRTSVSTTAVFSLFKTAEKSKGRGNSDQSSQSSSSTKVNPLAKNDYSKENLHFQEKYGKKFQSCLSGEQTYLRIAFSVDGKLLVAGGSVSPVVIFKTQPTFDSISIHSEIGKLTALDFSFSSKYMALATNDGSTSVVNWKTGKEHLNIQFSSKFSEHIHTQFYFMDKFLIQPEDNRLVFYSYRVQIPAWVKVIAGSFSLACQKITAVAAANQFYSNFVLAGLSNKSIEIFDANAEKVASTFSQCHSKNIACIRINEAPKGSNASTLSDCFLTSAPSSFDPIRLWDLRTNRCVTRIGDINSTVFVPNARPAFSPCGRYIASGFEENTVVVYDVRKINSRVTCLKGIRSTVLDCSFDRHYPMLWCGSRDGNLWNFKA